MEARLIVFILLSASQIRLKATAQGFLSASPWREVWLTVQCQCYLEAWRLFSSHSSLSKCDIFCRLYYLHCFSGSVKALPINLRNNLIWKDALSFLKEEDTRLTWNYGLAAIFFDEQHTAVYRSKENLQLGDHLWSVFFLYAKSVFNFHRAMSIETKIPLLFPHCHSWPWPQ